MESTVFMYYDSEGAFEHKVRPMGIRFLEIKKGKKLLRKGVSNYME
jgi:hypothetical protein